MSGDPDTIRVDNDAARLAAIRADVGFVGTDGETVLWQIARGDFEWLCARIAAVEAQRDELARALRELLPLLAAQFDGHQSLEEWVAKGVALSEAYGIACAALAAAGDAE